MTDGRSGRVTVIKESAGKVQEQTVPSIPVKPFVTVSLVPLTGKGKDTEGAWVLFFPEAKSEVPSFIFSKQTFILPYFRQPVIWGRVPDLTVIHVYISTV